MTQSPFPGGLDRLMPANSSDGAAAIGALCTVLGVGFGWMMAQEQMAQARPATPTGTPRPSSPWQTWSNGYWPTRPG
jgi:hypothetical protein